MVDCIDALLCKESDFGVNHVTTNHCCAKTSRLPENMVM